jgi:hypothetical protein
MNLSGIIGRVPMLIEKKPKSGEEPVRNNSIGNYPKIMVFIRKECLIAVT